MLPQAILQWHVAWPCSTMRTAIAPFTPYPACSRSSDATKQGAKWTRQSYTVKVQYASGGIANEPLVRLPSDRVRDPRQQGGGGSYVPRPLHALLMCSVNKPWGMRAQPGSGRSMGRAGGPPNYRRALVQHGPSFSFPTTASKHREVIERAALWIELFSCV